LPTAAQVAAAPRGAAADTAAVERPIPRGLVAPADALLAVLLVGSFAATQIDGIDVDAAIDPAPGRADALDRRLPRAFGRIDVGLGLAGATWLIGRAAESSTATRLGLETVEALVLGSALTATLKIGIGRSRPDTGAGDDDFHPFSFGRDHFSFPSGHASNAFAIATTVSRELGDEAPWVPFLAYPIATYTGLSRILDEKHWLTDVVAGAAVGVFSARVIGRLNRPSEEARSVGAGLHPRLLLAAGDGLLVGATLSLP